MAILKDQESQRLNSLISVATFIYNSSPYDKSRKQSVIWARWAVWAQLIKSGMTYAKAADIFDKDHSTAVYANGQHKALLAYSAEYREQYRRFETKLASVTKNTLDEVREKVYNVNTELVAMGFNYDYIDRFVKSSIEEGRSLGG